MYIQQTPKLIVEHEHGPQLPGDNLLRDDFVLPPFDHPEVIVQFFYDELLDLAPLILP